jgi:chaperonin GroEL (HSP60 family)
VWGPLAETATTDLRKAAAAVAAARGLGDARPGVVPGGGAAESRVAAAVRERAPAADDREALAVEAFADAVGTLVYTLAKNGGLDPLATRADLRAANDPGADDPARGLSLPEGRIVDAAAAGIVDPLAIRRHCYTAATEVASLLVGIDDAVSATLSGSAPDPGDAIYEDAADQQQSYLDEHDDTRWD